MEAPLQRPPHGHHRCEEDPQHAGLHSVIEGEGEGDQHTQHGEKKSVLKKVKDKAKKIKDTIKKHSPSHGHEHEHEHEGGHRQEGYKEDEEDDDDDEMENYPEVHGAPIYESTVIRSTNLPRETNVNIGIPTDAPGDTYVRDETVTRPFALGQVAPKMGRQPVMEASPPENKPAQPTSRHAIDTEKRNVEEPRVKIDRPTGLEEDPHSPKNPPAEMPPSNYQSKVSDPTGSGGTEAEVVPSVLEFGNLNVRDLSASKPEPEQRGDDLFAPQPAPAESHLNPELDPIGTPENQELNPNIQDISDSKDVPQDTIAEKISSATSAIADKALSARNVVASKLGYGGGGIEGQDSSKKPVSESATEYAHMVAEKLAPVYEKVAGAGSAVMSKVQESGGAKHEAGDTAASAPGTDRGVSMREYLAEKLRPGDEDKALSEVITNSFHKKKEERQPAGKLTVSEEVAARLGTIAENKREGEDALTAGSESSGQGVVDKLKDAVSLWLGKSTGTKTAQDSVSRSYVSDAGGNAASGVEQGRDPLVE